MSYITLIIKTVNHNVRQGNDTFNFRMSNKTACLQNINLVYISIFVELLTLIFQRMLRNFQVTYKNVFASIGKLLVKPITVLHGILMS